MIKFSFVSLLIFLLKARIYQKIIEDPFNKHVPSIIPEQLYELYLLIHVINWITIHYLKKSPN